MCESFNFLKKNSSKIRFSYSSSTVPGAVLEGFLRFPETTQDFPSTMGVSLFGYNISRSTHSGLNSSVN